MKDEIKEKIKAYYIGDDIDKVLDYITNLQEENERLEENNQAMQEEMVRTWEENEKLKMRNEKAKSLTNRTIEIIKQQPSGNDEWILERLNGINYCLGGDEE